mgnify:CR=1 FL=1
MIKTYINPGYSKWASLTKRPTVTYESLEPLVASVFESVKKYGDQLVIPGNIINIPVAMATTFAPAIADKHGLTNTKNFGEFPCVPLSKYTLTP